MNKKILLSICTSILTVAAIAGDPKALIVLFDGMRTDQVDNRQFPNIAKLVDGQWHEDYNGLFVDNMQTAFGCEPSSVGNHSTILTGVSAKRHRANAYLAYGDYSQNPLFFDYLLENDPEMNMYMNSLWREYPDLPLHSKLNFKLCKSDQEGAEYCLDALKKSETDLVFYNFDASDWEAHSPGNPGGWYPYSDIHVNACKVGDSILGELLAVIENRENFTGEDWLIILCSDHGGYGKTHGLPGGHSHSPLAVIASKDVEQGLAAGQHDLADFVPTILSHFNVKYDPEFFDGAKIEKAREQAEDALSEELVAYFDFDASEAVNQSGHAISAVPAVENYLSGESSGRFGGALQLGKSADDRDGMPLRLENSAKLDGNLTITMWVRSEDDMLEKTVPHWQDVDKFTGHHMLGMLATTPAVISNKIHKTYDCAQPDVPGLEINLATVNVEAKAPGYTLIAARETEGSWNGLHGELLNAPFIELGPFEASGGWKFVALTMDDNNSCYFYSGSGDEFLYRIAANMKKGLKWNSGRDFVLGGAGRGDGARFHGQIDDFAMWNRGLTTQEIRNIYEAGRQGKPLADLLK